MSDELKPCPFCGSSQVRVLKGAGFVRCNKCLADGPIHSGVNSDHRSAEKWNNRAMSGVDQSDEYRDRYQAVVKAFREAYPSLVPSLENIQEVFHGVADWYKQQAQKVKRIAELERELEAERSIRKTLRERVDQVADAIDKAGLLDDDATFLQNVQRIVRQAREAADGELKRAAEWEQAYNRASSDADFFRNMLASIRWHLKWCQLEDPSMDFKENIVSVINQVEKLKTELAESQEAISKWRSEWTKRGDVIRESYESLEAAGFADGSQSLIDAVKSLIKQARAASESERYYESLQALARDRCGSDDIAALLEELRFLRSETERPAAEEEDLSTVARELAAASGILIRTIGAQELHVQRMSRELKERNNA